MRFRLYKTVSLLGLILFSMFVFSRPLKAQSTEIQPPEVQSPSWTADAALVASLSKRRPGVIYDERQVPEFTLTDPLIDLSGNPVVTADQWNESRRPELINLFREHVYGHRPNIPFTIEFRETKSARLFDGNVTATQFDAVVSVSDRKYVFPVAIFRHASQTGVTPGIVHINNRSFVSIDDAESSDQDFFPIVDLVSRGFTVATFYTSDVDPDNAKGYPDGIRSFFASDDPPTPTAWRALSAWGWAASQILDHLDRDPRVDAQRVAVAGHSRGGKAALWAAAEDTRFVAAYGNQSGCGGAALSRRCFGERVKRITETFPHWFNETFATYAERESDLPIDQHELISLLAPRHVFINSADGDLWADPIGEYASLVNAEPVFALLGQPGITDAKIPPLDQTRVRGVVGYRVRSGKHSLTPRDWDEFLKFADEVLGPEAAFAVKPAGADSRRK